jgi:hypothetical protein
MIDCTAGETIYAAFLSRGSSTMPAAAVGIPEDDWQRTNACNLQHRTKEIVDIAMLIVTLLFCSSSVIMTGVWSLFLPATMPNKNAA